jgi:hypothetical protein
MPKTSNNEDRYTALEQWIRDAQAALALTEWAITISRDASDSDAWADIEPHPQAYSATLRIANDFWHQSSRKQLQILTHELTHLYLARADQAVQSLEEPLGKIAWAVFEPQFDNASEAATDRISLVLTRLLVDPNLPR